MIHLLKKGLLKHAAALICSAAMLLPLCGIGRNSSAYAETASVMVSDEIELAANLFRFAATTDSWRDETELIYELDGTKWHNYTLVVSGANTKLYLDGKEVCHTTETHGQLADMDSGTSSFIGKSYYADDTCFKGSIDNIRIYKSALTASEIGGASEVHGDVNADGEFNLADVVTLQNWLLQKSGTQLKNWKAADLCTDGKLNVFDLMLLKRSYFNNRK